MSVNGRKRSSVTVSMIGSVGLSSAYRYEMADEIVLTSIVCTPSDQRLRQIFPVDAMHPLSENVMKQLLEYWCGELKPAAGPAVTENGERFVIPSAAWREIDEIIAVSLKHIPAVMTRGLKSVSNRRTWTADTYSFFLVTLGPAILKGYLPQPYFDHFVQLSEISKSLLGLSNNDESIDEAESGLEKWVNKFDR